MSEYLSKKAVLDWLESQYYREDISHDRARGIQMVKHEIEQGTFDTTPTDSTEVTRLRAENERYRKALERIAETDIPYAPMTDHSVIRFYEQVAREALASTPTEPSGAERVIGLRAWDKELEMFHDEVVAIDFRLRKIRVFSRSEDDYPSDWLPLERFVLYGINAPEGAES